MDLKIWNLKFEISDLNSKSIRPVPNFDFRNCRYMHRVFILSPARTTGKRAGYLFAERASFELARRIRREPGVPIGEVFSFLSGLYFRGKLAYARQFANPPEKATGCHVLTSDAGLMPCDQVVSLERLKRFAETPIDVAEPRYRQPLEATAAILRSQLPRGSQVVLLGSIATPKYVDILHECFGERLVLPREFIGRGDMSRGGLLLRAVENNVELEYLSIAEAETRTGKRAPKLEPIKRPRRGP
jgi:hypothetical protein